MTGPIAPALTPEEWKNREAQIGSGHIRAADGYVDVGVGDGWYGNWGSDFVHELAVLIALANHSLPDSDPRKITREWVIELRALAGSAEAEHDNAGEFFMDFARYERFTKLRLWADALESYLPPETP